MADRVSTFVNLMFQSFLVFSLSGFPLAAAVSTLTPLTPGQSLKNWETLSSPGQVFELGFFTPDESKSLYLGIRYRNRIPETAVTDIPFATRDGQRVVWVANRDYPIRDTSGTFTIERNGTMLITRRQGPPFLLHAGNSSGQVTLTLLDSGNLILREGSTDNGRVLWESFDYPTDSLLPGMRLRANKPLVSWLSVQVPARAFSLGIDPSGSKQLIIWERGVVYWKSGVWNGTNFGSLLTGLTVFNHRFVTVNGETYFTFSATNASINSWWSLQEFGQIWQPIFTEGPEYSVSVEQEPPEPCLGTGNDIILWLC